MLINIVLVFGMAFFIALFAANRKMEKYCWIALFLSLSVRVNLLYLHIYPHFVGRQNMGIGVTLTDIIALGMLVAFALTKRKRNELDFPAVEKYGLYFLFCLFSFFYTKNIGMTINEIGTQVEILVLMVLILNYFKTTRFSCFVNACMINTIIQCGACIIQLITGQSFRSGESLTIRYGVYRCEGIYLSAGELAMVSLISFFLFFELWMSVGTKNTKRMRYFLIMCCDLFCIIAAQSRTTFIIIVIGFVLKAIMKNQNIRRNEKQMLRILILVGGITIGVMLIEGQIDFGNSADMLASRLLMWDMGLKVFFESPFIGIGINAYTAFNSVFSNSPILWERTNPVHNIYIMELAETGLIGLVLLYVNYYIPMLYNAYRKYNTNRYASILFVVLFLQLIYGFTGWVFYSQSLRFFNVAFFAVLLSGCQEKTN